MLHALDFGLPRGESILAARSGKVIFREDRYSACGGPELATRGNYVVVDHGDQTSALYLHLEKVQAAVGQVVEQGDVLGTNGVTGWSSCAPHLHFQIQQNAGVWFSRSLPVTFNDPDVRAQDPNGVLKYNQMYASGNRSAGGAPAASSAQPAANPPPPPTATPSPSPAPSGGPSVQASAASASGGARHSVGAASAVRERPTTESPRLALVVPGQEIDVLEVVTGQPVDPADDRWARLRFGTLEGYMYSRLISGLAAARPAGTPTPPPAGTPEPSAPSPMATPPREDQSGQNGSRLQASQHLEPGQWQTKVGALAREQPTRQSARATVLSGGTQVEVRGIVDGEVVEAGEGRWARIEWQGRELYVYVRLLVPGGASDSSRPAEQPTPPPQPAPSPAPPSQPDPPPATPTATASPADDAAPTAEHASPPSPSAPGARTRQAASVRLQPTRTSSRVGILADGTGVEILEWTEGEAVEEGQPGWARVRGGELEGFVYAGLLALD